MISQLDHIVLTVRDIPETVSFYEKVLGMKRIILKGHRVALGFGNQKINLHPLGHEYEPKADIPMAGSADICFLLDIPLEEALARVETAGVPLTCGIVERTGARGPMRSFYLRDPDLNLIELASYDRDSGAIETGVF